MDAQIGWRHNDSSNYGKLHYSMFTLDMLLLNRTGNGTFPMLHVDGVRPFEAIEKVLLGTMIFLILSGNTLVCFAFATGGRRLRTITSRFVVNLALSDILVGAVSLPLWLLIRAGYVEPFSKVYLIYISLDIISGTASILNLTIISLERLCAVKFPSMHHKWEERKCAITLVLALVWCISIALAGLHFLRAIQGWHYYTLLIVIMDFILPTVIIVISYTIIGVTARRKGAFLYHLKRDMKLAMMIGIVILLFLLCWSPFFVLNMMFEYCKSCIIPFTAVSIVKYLHYSNSLVNPIVYAFANPDYRNSFKTILLRYILCKKAKTDQVKPQVKTTATMTNVELYGCYSNEECTAPLRGNELNNNKDSMVLMTNFCSEKLASV